MRYVESVKAVKRAANKLKREVLRLPPFNYVWDMQYHAALGRHGSTLPWIRERDAAMVRALRKDGVWATSLDAFELPGTSAFLDSTKTLVEELRALIPRGNAIRLPLERLIAHPAIYLWGLQERLLDMVENYIGLPLMYHGADLRREIPDGRATDVRQWHVDVEDARMVKVITYMNDVVTTGGPFEYLSRDSSRATAKTLNYSSGFVTDRAMSAVIPESQWQAATGPFATAAWRHLQRVPSRQAADRARAILGDVFVQLAPSGENLRHGRLHAGADGADHGPAHAAPARDVATAHLSERLTMGRTVDRGFVKMVAYKRIATGIAGLVGAVVMAVLALTQGHSPTPMFGLAIRIFVGGGGWALRDGLRMRAMLRES